MRYTITSNNIHLIESYKVSKKDFQKELNQIRGLHPRCEVWKRSNNSLIKEWAVHNFFYKVGYQREQTKDCDLDYPADHPEWLYIICGLLVWLFVW